MCAKSKLTWAVILVAVISLAGVAAATAQTTPGNAPTAAAANQTGLVTINPGQEHWYTFHSASADPQAGNKEITVMLASRVQGSVTFDVWTPAGLQRAAEGKTDINARPVGAGTLHPIKDGDRYGGKPEWTGGSDRPQDYVIQVKSKAWGPVQYELTVEGNYVQFPYGTPAEQAAKQGAVGAGGSQPQLTAQPTVQATAAANTGGKAPANQPAAANQAAATPAAAGKSPAAQPAGPAAGSGPGSALPLDAALHEIKPGQSQWYVLNYPGESKNGDIPSGTVLLTAVPWGSANFNIWTNDRLRALELGDTRTGVPVGSGMLHPVTREGVTTDRYDGKPAWTNRSQYAATFYIEVQATGDKPSSYSLGYVQK